MKLRHLVPVSNPLRGHLALVVVLTFAGCAHYPVVNEPRTTAKDLREARSKVAPEEKRAALYLQAANKAYRRIQEGNASEADRDTYNAATGELTVLLREAHGGKMWNHPLVLTTEGGVAYQLRFAPANPRGVWAPDYFTSLALSQKIPDDKIKHPNRVPGTGGTLVGIRKVNPREPFTPHSGVSAPVTAVVDFKGRNATLALHDPNREPVARVASAPRPLAADFSAPLAFYPAPNEFLDGIMGAMKVSHYMDKTGIYMLEPYDPNRIPIIFVHGLISTGRMWRNVVNEIKADPVLRSRYQCWVFNYPTGNPVLYSALRLRDDLAKVEQTHGFPQGFVLVGHSMGGIVSRLQAITITRDDWHNVIGSSTEKLLSGVTQDSVIQRAMIFKANPKVRRLVFVCTPHRGSNMATSSIGELGMSLITLPATLTTSITSTVADTLSSALGSKSLPNSIFSLSPHNPTLKLMDQEPILAPYHTIYGDRGKGDGPKSSDGVVPYWSSHLDHAQSEKAVPAPHGACDYPETLEELKRILHVDLTTRLNSKPLILK